MIARCGVSIGTSLLSLRPHSLHEAYVRRSRGKTLTSHGRRYVGFGFALMSATLAGTLHCRTSMENRSNSNESPWSRTRVTTLPNTMTRRNTTARRCIEARRKRSLGCRGRSSERFDVDANVVRRGYVVLALVYGLGIAIYLAMWLLFLVHRPGRGRRHRERGPRQGCVGCRYGHSARGVDPRDNFHLHAAPSPVFGRSFAILWVIS